MIYFTKSICDLMNIAIKEKQLSYREVGEYIGKSTSTVCRILKGNATKIDIQTAKKIEELLDIQIPDSLDNEEKLIRQIKNLEAENKALKQLLIEKWSKE